MKTKYYNFYNIHVINYLSAIILIYSSDNINYCSLLYWGSLKTLASTIINIELISISNALS